MWQLVILKTNGRIKKGTCARCKLRAVFCSDQKQSAEPRGREGFWEKLKNLSATAFNVDGKDSNAA